MKVFMDKLFTLESSLLANGNPPLWPLAYPYSFAPASCCRSP